MALPKLTAPKYTTVIPSTGKTIEYRPFLVKEEKILLMAQESEDTAQLILAMKDIVKSCTYDKVNPNDLTSFDLEFLFLKLRAKSVGEISNVKIKCTECDHHTENQIDLDNINVVVDDKISKTIMLTSTVGINLRYIKVKDMAALSDTNKSQGELINNLIVASIESIFDETAVYPADTSSTEELQGFINSLNREQMSKIEAFISAAPKLQHSLKFTCKGCSHDNDVTLSGLQSFFE